MTRTAFTDIRDRSKDFRRGDIVYTFNPLSGNLIQIAGLVTAVHRAIGYLDIEFPWGNQRYSADEVFRVPPQYSVTLPPNKDTSYPAWDISRSRLDDRTLGRVASLAHKAVERVFDLRCRVAKHFANGRGRHTAMTKVMSSDPTVKAHEAQAAVEHVYGVIPKIGLYWYSPGRTYRPTRTELESGSFHCPRCRETMADAIYRKGTRLYSCVNCLFMISPEDIWKPEEKQAAKYAFQKLTSALEGRDDWVVAHAPGQAAAYHGFYGMSFTDGVWQVLGSDGNVVEIVPSPKQAYDRIMLLKQAERRPNNDAEDLVREVLEDPEADAPGDVEAALRETASFRSEQTHREMSDPDLTRIDFYRAAALADTLADASFAVEAGMDLTFDAAVL